MLIEELRSTFLFQKLSDEQLQELVQLGTETMFPAGETIFVEGEPADALLVLLDGEVELARSVGGQRVVIGSLSQPGDYAGGIRAFAASGTGGGYRATGTTMRDSRLFQLPSESLGSLLDAWLPMAKHMLDGYVHTFEAIEVAVRERGRLIALGTLAAGLTHELNNPAAAAKSASKDLRVVVDQFMAFVNQIANGELTPTQVQAAMTLRADAVARAAVAPRRSVIETGRLEEDISIWLVEHAVANEWELAPAFVAASLDLPWLEAAVQTLGNNGLSDALNWIANTLLATTFLDQIDDATSRISELVSAVKDYSFVDRSPEQEIDIHDGIEKTLVILGHKLRRGVEVVRDYDEHLPRVMADGSELNQVWTNLIDNAIDAMDGHGQVHIATQRDGAYILVEVSDQGPGIPAEIAPRIFDPFFTTKAVGAGSGLGLDITRRIVEDRYHGEVTFESSPGATRFLVRLPLVAKP
jgi:signal transduction histidine kinase